MTGFSSHWLELREPADHAARNAALTAAVAAFAAARPALTIVDLGAGTGSTLRALSPLLRPPQHWVLVDDDAALAAAGRRALADWAASNGRTARDAGGGLDVGDAGTPVTAVWHHADLAAADWTALLAGADLVTASALFDLVSTTFVERLAAAAAKAGVAVYAALDVDGAAVWEPPHPDDAAVATGFRRDQRRDKGFGPALGPDAVDVLAQALSGRGYAVSTAPSPWRLGAGEAALMAALADGWASAAVRAGVDPATGERWRRARATATACTIGHADLFAVPRG